MTQPGTLYVIAAPSGAGKTTLVKALTGTLADITVSISHTTRPMRPGEIDGVNYHFIDTTTFENMLKHGDFLEHALVFDNLYGTSKEWVGNTLIRGVDVILEIDWQGHRQIRSLFPDAISIFILPPSIRDLRTRLITRNQDNPEIIEKRLADVREAISHIHEFNYVVLNDDFDYAVHELASIIEAGRLTEKRQTTKFKQLINQLAII